MEDGIRNMVYKFADDTKVLAQVQSDVERKKLQEDLNELSEWTKNGKCLSIQRSVEFCM